MDFLNQRLWWGSGNNRDSVEQVSPTCFLNGGYLRVHHLVAQQVIHVFCYAKGKEEHDLKQFYGGPP